MSEYDVSAWRIARFDGATFSHEPMADPDRGCVYVPDQYDTTIRITDTMGVSHVVTRVTVPFDGLKHGSVYCTAKWSREHGAHFWYPLPW